MLILESTLVGFVFQLCSIICMFRKCKQYTNSFKTFSYFRTCIPYVKSPSGFLYEPKFIFDNNIFSIFQTLSSGRYQKVKIYGLIKSYSKYLNDQESVTLLCDYFRYYQYTCASRVQKKIILSALCEGRVRLSRHT